MTIPTSFKSAARTALLGTLALGAFGTLAAFAQETAPEVVEAAAPIIDKGDVAWMMTSCALVLFMTIPGLALFYGGLVRAKNMLSVLMQCTVIASVMMIVWILWGYSMAFGGGTSPFWGGLGKVFLAGVTTDTTSATFTDGVVLPEYLFITFQMTFAAITPALIVGAFAERIKFRAVVLFSVLWGTFVYFPVAHMVWDGAGYIFNLGAIDFAGGTVVHINAGVAALVGCFFVGKRLGYGKDNMAPHSMTLTMVGASMLWVGWFGFNVGSNLEATAGATLAMINTFVCTAAAVLSWSAVESMIRGKASMLGAASGMVAGLVAITPACGTIGPVGAIVLGIVVSPVCYFFVASVKTKFGYDDSLDVFGIHGIGGILGALGTGVLTAPGLGGTGGEDFSIGGQVWIQFVAIVITIVWCGVISAILYKVVDLIVGLRPTEEAEREGLDLTSHGEVAYHS
ncbi:MAG: ammonium transporter [Alphaproteobacteria bacterium]|nr:ammonium transporter [Alphaproteobacteria bacterium]MBU0805260.1 ammonium transporter [Alphaproteobacteria bacterium]MBU0870759.1 ammonium transporter [Alphaproteobacteria bacterium]MBU1401566.1 ammonium transporter [Alphaproteobacteria bacterium]MBU1592017.1 ammonium transporter [Alphaproteobacteria bacterium]